MKKKYTQEEVVVMIVEVAMTAMGDEWVPQQDKPFKELLNNYGLLKIFKKVYGGR